MEFRSQTFTVADLYNWHKAGELILQPKFQRRRVWKPIARSYLIDTVLRGLPMPKIYYRMQVDPELMSSRREVVDGQQRLDTLFSYIDGEFKLNRKHFPDAAGRRFQDLSQHLQTTLLSYEISADILVGADDQQVLQIFARINSYNERLNAQEKRNAQYIGAFKQTVYDLGIQHVAFWMDRGILSFQQIARMAEAELASELVVGMLAGLQDKKKSLDGFYREFEEDFPPEDDMRIQFETVIRWIDLNIGDQLGAMVFRRRTLFYSLFLAVADAMFGIPAGEGPFPKFAKKLDPARRERLLARLGAISHAFTEDEPRGAPGRFVRASQRQTDNIKPRQTRHKVLVEVVRGL